MSSRSTANGSLSELTNPNVVVQAREKFAAASARTCASNAPHGYAKVSTGTPRTSSIRAFAPITSSDIPPKIRVGPRVTAGPDAGTDELAQFAPTHERLPSNPRWLARPRIASAAVVTHHKDSSWKAVARNDGESVLVNA